MTVLEIGLGVLGGLGIAGAGAAWAWGLRTARRNRACLENAPVGLIRVRGRRLEATPLALEFLHRERIGGPDDIADAFADDHAALFRDSLNDLLTEGRSFSLTLDTADGHATVNLEGRTIGDEAAIWVDDATTTAWLSESYAEAERGLALMRELLNLLPMPVWWRDAASLDLKGVNRAYAQALDMPRERALAEQKELGRGTINERGRGLARRAAGSAEPQSESHYVVMGGQRRMLDFTEAALGPGRAHVAGFARDATALEELQATLSRHIAAHDQVLENMASAIAVFGADKRLKFYNQAYLDLWKLEEAQLTGHPGFGEILELMRARRLLPEIVDFPAYKQQQEAKFVRLLEPEEELLHLPDERTVRAVSTPHPLGGLMMVFEDVTDRLALERSYNTLIAVQQATLNNLFEGVAVWGSDGRLRIWNEPFVEMWGFQENFLRRGPHVGEMLDFTRKRWFHEMQESAWADLRQKLILHFTEPKSLTRRLELTDGRVINVAHVPLPDAQCLVLYSDVTDTVRVERALAERNAAFERADLLKSQFISNVSYELRTPLNAIQGFAAILESEYYGDLNKRQATHVRHISDAAETLMMLINDILDLATIQAGFMELNREDVALADLMGEAVAQEKDRADQHQIAIDCAVSGVMSCDRDRLKRALSNILDVMISFAPCHSISISSDTAAAAVHRLVFACEYGEDADEDRELLMRRFEGNDPHALRTGAGLALALAKSLVDLHGGTVELDADYEGGFAILCDFPAEAVAPAPAKLPVAEPPVQG